MQRGTLKGPINIVAAAAAVPASHPISDLVASAGLTVSTTLEKHLADGKINTLSDVRRAGGVASLVDAGDLATAQLIDAHASLALVSANLAANGELIKRGFDSALSIARMPQANFVMTAASILGSEAAARVHAQATALYRGLDQIILSGRVDAANGVATGLPKSVETEINPEDWLRCLCAACDAAPSPGAYLADLITYILRHLKSRGELVSLQFLVDTFDQPFGDLAIDCDAIEEQVRQVRICVEVLRSYLVAHPPSSSQTIQLEIAEYDYLLATYSALLAGLGTSYDEIRLARNADTRIRSALADRLGLIIDPYGANRPDALDGLLLDLPTSQPAAAAPPLEPQETQVERLFGLVDTTRNPLSDGPTLNDPNKLVARWNLSAVTWGRNTAADGAIYFSLQNDPTGTEYQALLFLDKADPKKSLVATGRQTVVGGVLAGSIAIGEENDSGLSGRVEITTPIDTAGPIELGAIPRLTAWQLATLRAEWRSEDHATDNFMDGVTTVSVAEPLSSKLPLGTPLRYDPAAHTLSFSGVMSPAILDQFLGTPTASFLRSAVRTLYLQSQRQPVIDPDVIGPDDFRSPVPSAGGDQPFDLWLTRRNWVDTGLMTLASKTKTVSGTTVPDIEQILQAMLQPLTYGTTKIIPWSRHSLGGSAILLTSVLKKTFDKFWEHLADGSADVGAIQLELGADFGLTIDAFNRLMDIWHQDQAAQVDPQNPAVTADAWSELFSLLMHVVKARFFADWRSEEAKFETALNTKLKNPVSVPLFSSNYFVVSLREPAIGPWPPTASSTQPLIDPSLVGLTDLPEPGAGGPALKLWNDRTSQVTQFTSEIRSGREAQGSPGGVDAALKVAVGDPLPADSNSVAQDLRSADSAKVASATATVHTAFFMSVDAFNRLMVIRAMDNDPNPAERPTPAIWTELYAILTTAKTQHDAYPAWLTEEANLVAGGAASWTPHKGYWLARKASLPLWRSSIASRSQWHAALATRKATPIIDPDLVGAADLATSFPGNAALDLWLARQNQISALLGAPMPKAGDVASVDNALSAALGIGGTDLVVLGTQRDQGANIAPRLAQLNLMDDAFDLLLTVRTLVQNKVGALQSEWDGFCSILAQVTKERRFYGGWLEEEAERNIVLGPDLFQIPVAPITDPINPLKLPPWRATPAVRRNWEDRLTSRIEEEATLKSAAANLADTVESVTLTQLRDALVDASDAPPTDHAAKADWLTNGLMIDCETDGCEKTTRIEQAIETLQTVMTSLRNGQLGSFDLPLSSAPAAESFTSNRIDVFARGPDIGLWWRWWDGTNGPDGTWQDWQPLGGSIIGEPCVASVDFGNLEVFAVGTDNTLQHIQFWGGRWSEWDSFGGNVVSAPAAASPEQGSFDVFAVGEDGALWRFSGTSGEGGVQGGWSPSNNPVLAAGITSAAAVVCAADGIYDVFVRGGDAALWHARFDPNKSVWTTPAWESLGGGLAGGVAAVSPQIAVISAEANTLDVFAEGTNGTVFRLSRDAGGVWGKWTSLDGSTQNGPAASTWGSGRFDIFVRGQDGYLWHKWFDGATWHDWRGTSELTLDAPSFDEEWKWMGSYATWRAAVLVFLYPENLLDPTLRKWQTPGFQALVNSVQGSSTLTPAQAATAADEYVRYFSDVCSMTIEVSTDGINTWLHDENGVATALRALWYMIARGGATRRVYWSTWDKQAPAQYAQSFWDLVPGLDGQTILGVVDAVPYATADGRRFLCLFVQGQAGGAQTLLLTWYDLDAQSWNASPFGLDLPEQTTTFDAVVVPKNSEQGAPTVRVRAASGKIYENALNADATSWIGAWTLLVWTKWTRIDENFSAPPAVVSLAGLLTVNVPTRVAAVSRDSDHIDVFVTASDGSINWASYTALSFSANWSTFSQLLGDPSAPACAPTAAVARDSTHIDIFFTGDDGKVHNNAWDTTNGWTGWTSVPMNLQTLPPPFGATVNVTSPVTAVTPSPGRIHLFFATDQINKNVVTSWSDNGAWNANSVFSFNLGGASRAVQDKAVTPILEGTNIHAFAFQTFLGQVGVDIFESTIPAPAAAPSLIANTGWVSAVSGTLSFGTKSIASIGIVNRSSAPTPRWDIFVVGDDRSIWNNWRDPTQPPPQPWVSWSLVGTPQDKFVAGSAISALSRFPSTVDLFAVGVDGSIYWNFRDDNANNGGWQGWTRIGDMAFELPQPSLRQQSVTAISKNPTHIDLFVVGPDGGVYTASWDSDPNVFWIIKPPPTPTPFVPFPMIGGPFDIPGQLSSEQLVVRRGAIKRAMEQVLSSNPPDQLSNTTYLQEAYYFVPIYLAEQLQKQGRYTAALDWFRTVYDYAAPSALRNIYYGFELEKNYADVGRRNADWLLDPLDPHLIAGTRRFAYARYTVLSIVQCLLDYADSRFSYDTSESDAQARTLYMTALALLDLPIFDQSSRPCEELLIGLRETAIVDKGWQWSSQALARELGVIDRVPVLSAAVPQVQKLLTGEASWPAKLTAARKVIWQAKGQIAPAPNLREVLTSQEAHLQSVYSALLATPTLEPTVAAVTTAAGRIFDGAVPRVRASLKDSAVTAGAQAVAPVGTGQHLGPSVAGSTGSAPTEQGTRLPVIVPTSPDRRHPVRGIAPGLNQGSPKDVITVPTISYLFCVPPDPLLRALRGHAENDLYKLRHCMNIAGVRREIDPYSAPTDATSGLPIIVGGQISIPGAVAIQPTPYTYAVLIARAQNLVQTATAMEQAMLSALEKYDQGVYAELEARQNLQVAVQTVQLNTLIVKQATDGVVLARLQQKKVQVEIDHAQQLVQSDIASREDTAIGFMQVEAGLQVGAAAAFASAAIVSGLSTPAGFLTGASESDIASGLSAAASAAGTFAAINQARASQEAQQIDWQYQLSSGQADYAIAGQQIVNAQDQVQVANQQLVIAQLQASQKSDVVNFLANKFTNADLYRWMSSTLMTVYSFFLRQATAVARSAENQMAFERQETPPGFIKPDYWQPPAGTSSTAPADTKGLTGAERLNADTVALDQYYLDTDKRKLQLTKTLSLGQLFPFELQRLRDTGVMSFATPMRLFDQDFPGHYLRLIQKVTTSVIALIPPSQGIKATLSNTASTRVVVGPQVFQSIVVRRDPQSVALSSPANAMGVFTLDPQPNLLLPFQGLGVEAQWEFMMPKAANAFDYSTIADVLISIDYTALDSPDYRQQVLRQLNDEISSELPFSFRNDLADQWYDLHNPDQTATPMSVQFSVARSDFPANIDDIRIQQVLLYFARADGSTFEVPVGGLRFTERGATTSVGGAARSVSGAISTRRGNAASWIPIVGKTPVGTWELTLTDTEVVRNWFANDLITDILFDITYSARTPPYPQS